MAFDINKLNEIDVNDIALIGSAPLLVKAIIIAVLCIILAVTGYFVDTTAQLTVLDRAEKEEVTHKATLDKKQSKAVNLKAYKQQLEDMRESFGALLRQLPNKTEIETLLTDISQTGISTGLEINYFKPSGLNPKEFYAEFPIKLKVTGRYHEFAEFISGVAALPRIVTVRDIIIDKAKSGDGVKLTMELTAVTYQYIDENK